MSVGSSAGNPDDGAGAKQSNTISRGGATSKERGNASGAEPSSTPTNGPVRQTSSLQIGSGTVTITRLDEMN
jgi:hypothetical protein